MSRSSASRGGPGGGSTTERANHLTDVDPQVFRGSVCTHTPDHALEECFMTATYTIDVFCSLARTPSTD